MLEMVRVFFISYIAHSKIHALKHTFTFYHILHIPHIKKPLLSIQKFYLENNVIFKFHPFVYYVKNLMTNDVFFCD
jgi:hypothetical protein